MNVEWNYDPETRAQGFLFVLKDGERVVEYCKTYPDALKLKLKLEGDSDA